MVASLQTNRECAGSKYATRFARSRHRFVTVQNIMVGMVIASSDKDCGARQEGINRLLQLSDASISFCLVHTTEGLLKTCPTATQPDPVRKGVNRRMVNDTGIIEDDRMWDTDCNVQWTWLRSNCHQ